MKKTPFTFRDLIALPFAVVFLLFFHIANWIGSTRLKEEIVESLRK